MRGTACYFVLIRGAMHSGRGFLFCAREHLGLRILLALSSLAGNMVIETHRLDLGLLPWQIGGLRVRVHIFQKGLMTPQLMVHLAFVILFSIWCLHMSTS